MRECIFFNNVDTLVDEINRREESVEEEKITSFYSYSHGIYFHNNGSVAYGYHAERELDRKLQLTSEDVSFINSEAFSKNAKSYFYSCQTGRGSDDKISLAQLWANSTKTDTYAATGRTNYLLWRATPSERDVRKAKCTYNSIDH